MSAEWTDETHRAVRLLANTAPRKSMADLLRTNALHQTLDEIERLRAEVARLRGLADDDAAVERGAVELCATDRKRDIWRILYPEERLSFEADARAALRAALNPEGEGNDRLPTALADGQPTVFFQDPVADSKSAAAYHGSQRPDAVALTAPECPSLMVLSEFQGEAFMTLTKWAQTITRYDDGTVKVAGPPMFDPLAAEDERATSRRPMYNISPPESCIYMGGIQKVYPMGQLILEAAARQGLTVHAATGSALAGLGINPITITERTQP